MTTTNNILPSLRNRALLVNLSFSKPTMTRLDRKATNDAEIANNAHGALKTQRLLYPKHMIDPITSHESAMRTFLKTRTVEWGGTGLYLLDTRHFMEVANQLEQMKLEHAQLVTVFAQNWANVMAEAEHQQGALFDPSTYPDIADVVSQFTVTTQYLPVGDISGGLFDAVEQELRDAITEQVTTSTNELVLATMAEPYERIIDAVLNLHDKTRREDGRIYDSLIDNLRELVRLLPALNIADDPRLASMGEFIEKHLLPSSADAIRDPASQLRMDIAENSGKMLTAMGIDPTAVSFGTTQTAADRKQVARDTTQDILSKMKGFI